jgi:hypothetical protein
MSTFGVIWGLLSFVLWIALLCWIYSDAEANGYSGCLWAILFLFFNLPALVVYLVFFHGISAPRAFHRAVSRNDDLLYRSQNRTARLSSAGAGQYASGWGNTVEPVSMGRPDPDFRDETLDRLIAANKLSEARTYMKDMISVAREMNDQRGASNYRQYEQRISQASMRRGNGSY